jgi:hypothetical protein
VVKLEKVSDEGNNYGFATIHLSDFVNSGYRLAICDGAARELDANATFQILHSLWYRVVEIEGVPVREDELSHNGEPKSTMWRRGVR